MTNYQQHHSIPVVDYGDSNDAVRTSLTAACEEWGIFHLINHPIAPDISRQAITASKVFFSQSLSDKQRLSRTLENPWGYYDRELTRNLRDRKEIFDIGTGCDIPWPHQPTNFRSAMESLSQYCYQLGLNLLGLLSEGLEVSHDRLRSAFEPQHSSFTRLNYYPISDSLKDTRATPAGPLGISPHTDAGGLTILLQDEVTGLQLLKDEWRDIKPLAGALTINIGDMLQVWSNDRFRAPVHRVLASCQRPRYSIACFLNPARECVVEPLLTSIADGDRPHYRPVRWAQFRDLRAQGDYGDYGEEVQIAHFKLPGLPP
ncbi:MAG: hypothetical protein HRT77_04645 [Halioglobus sp.]|nr:hypothetical protein [Halioglobus sp.]